MITLNNPFPVYFDTHNVASPRTWSVIAPSFVLKGDLGLFSHHPDFKQLYVMSDSLH